MSHHYSGPDCAIREQRTGISQSKRRWSEVAPMRAHNGRLIAVHTDRREGP
jgi:hypothetical protein